MSEYEMNALAEIFDEAFMEEDFNRWCGLMESDYGKTDCPVFRNLFVRNK